VEDDPRPLPGHPARRRPRGQEVRLEPGDHGPQKVVGRHIDKWRSLHVATRDEVEGHVDAAGTGRDGLQVGVHRALVGGVEDGHLGRPAVRLDVGGDRLHGRSGSAGKEHLGALAGEGPGDPPPIPPPPRR
jgi:hypothetical protein